MTQRTESDELEKSLRVWCSHDNTIRCEYRFFVVIYLKLYLFLQMYVKADKAQLKNERFL